MLQKLENFYLAILRFVVLLVAGLLLIVVMVLALRSTAALYSSPGSVNRTPQVAPAVIESDVLATLNAAYQSAAPNQKAQSATTNQKAVRDPNQVYYAQVAASVLKFVHSNFPDQYNNVDPQDIVDDMKRLTDVFDTENLKAAYAKGLAENMASALSDPAIVQFAKLHSPQHVIPSVTNSYTDEFNQQIKDIKAKNDAAQAKYLAEQHGAKQSLYHAAVGFGIFLLIVFLLIVIKIERNLRPENRAKA